MATSSDVRLFRCSSWIDQITDDNGTTADNLNGFSGRAFGIGPLLTYPERSAQEALGHNSKAVHRAYAKRALMRIPSLQEYEEGTAIKTSPIG